MNIPEEFGNYLLLKKLREDALGETFRGGRVGGDGIDQVVLLRVFNGPGIDGEKLWQRVSGRAAVQQALRSPNVGSGVDLGKVRSYPYAAYDYVSGKNLATLFAQAARQRQPIPVDHALLISERVALALAAAYETRVQDERVLHGFVVPHLVMISNEGETRLLGFEVAPGLRELWAAGWRADDLRGYLAPEASGGAPVGKADDVYSLGAILFELLASERLPLAPPGTGYAPLIDAMVLPNEGTPLPEGIAALLKKSLVPSAQRIPDAITWHKTLSKLMIEGHYTSTTFNLAFFMHGLFRDEIDRESQEIEAERKLELPRRGAAAGTAGTAAGVAPMLGGAGAAAAAGSLAGSGAAGSGLGAAAGVETRERTGVRGPGWAGGPAAAGAGAARGDRKLLWIGLAAAAALALAAGGYLLFGRGGGARPAAQPAGAAATAGAGASTAADAARKATALQAQIQQMIEARSKELETKLKSQYDDNIKQLQQKLEESRRAAAQEKEKEKARSERQAASGASLSEAAAPAASASGESRAARSERAETPAPAASSATGGGSQRATAPAAQSSSAAAAAAQREPAGSAPAPAATAQAALVTPSVPVGSAAAPASGGHQPQLQVGDLVEPGGAGVVPPRVVYRALPRYPAAARRMNRSAEVLVKVLVNQDGKVEKVERQGDVVGLGFDEAAIEAARHSNYQPATKDGVRVRMWVLMKVAFASPG
jgi:TonB family protein